MMKLKSASLKTIPFLLLMAVTAAIPVAAQQAPVTPMATAPSYQIAPGDVLSVTVVNFPSLSAPQTMVTPDGTISVPLLDQVTVTGMTEDQVKQLLIKQWKSYVKNPSVTVSITQKHPQTVVLNGYLNHTGTIDYRPDLHLLEALAQMGGSLPNSDPTNAVLTHADGTKQTIDLSHPEKKSDDADVNVVLQPGDVLYIPEQKGKINVVGEVKQPGTISYKENITVLDAIAASGDINQDTADLDNATLTHNGVTRKLDLYSMLRKGDLHDDVLLSSGDTISIPERPRAYVTGDVSHQGWYYYKHGDHIQDALSNAGLAPDADTGKINLIHVNSDRVVTKMDRVNFDDFQLRGKTSGNPEIQPGDSLYIPKKNVPFKIQDMFGILSGVGAIANTKYALQH